MPIPLSPETKILERMKEIARDANFWPAFGVVGDFTIRHYRHRKAQKSERPGMALRYDGSSVDEGRGAFHSGGSEVCWQMPVSIVLDLPLLAEKTDHTLVAGDANDATGWDRLTAIGRYVAGLYVKMDSPLRLLVDDILYGDVDPDDDSQPDDGRLAASVVVLYRTLEQDPLYLLSPEENAP